MEGNPLDKLPPQFNRLIQNQKKEFLGYYDCVKWLKINMTTFLYQV